MIDKPKVLHLVYECVGAPTGGMGLHVRELCKRTCDEFDITVVDFDMHSQEGAFWIVGKGGEYRNIPHYMAQHGLESRPTTPPQWRAGPGEYRVLNVFGTNSFDPCGNVYIEQHVTLQMYLRNIHRHIGWDWIPAIVCVHDSHLWWVAETLHERWLSKIVTTVHLSAQLSNPGLGCHLSNRWIMHAELTSYTQSDAVIGVSKHYQTLIEQNAHRKAECILNGVDSEALERVEHNAAMRLRYPDYKKLVGFVGRLTPQKGISFIIDAARSLPNYHFVVISHWHPMEGCNTVDELRAAVLKLPNLVWEQSLTQEEKFQVMKVCDIGIVPSRFEPFGIVALEWLGLGVPLIASNVGGLPEFCTHENSTRIKPTARGLIEALRHHYRNEKHITAGLETTRFLSWDTVAQKTSRVYRKVL